MDYSQLFVFVIMFPVFLQILLPLAILTGYGLLRLLAILLSPFNNKIEQWARADTVKA